MAMSKHRADRRWFLRSAAWKTWLADFQFAARFAGGSLLEARSTSVSSLLESKYVLVDYIVPNLQASTTQQPLPASSPLFHALFDPHPDTS
ncbi:hypothetical protein DOTSEDRAFT_69490 [Dothistroma septosporum NZE10]|uniref:Uncharacterized protein n=1 Tax=Dothistroma septosporum (strain NZE10 / CBS 128990) TaxID=675120 RepID=N1PYS2_DOTSN|nr:hypothetical protein DOTSEDRAFT_69490 [Dothistroma septosporum NZE10]